MQRPPPPAGSPTNRRCMSRPTIPPSADPTTAAAPGPHSLHGAVPISIIFFFLVGFLSIYLLRDLVEYLASAWPAHRRGVEEGTPPNPRCPDGPRGLGPAALAAFPVRRYSSLKGLREGVDPETECAVCISEFDDDDPVRLLTACRHTFHQGCIDQWLASHPTCPVCRCDLREPPVKMATAGQGATAHGGGEEAEQP
ncbi:hypothetical protein Taro_024246 [Colocasia esculenta]|uniref:RING-type E3 ubiquitin transferase n=1 Tax=Colocasia esculenta TaxID=4460 RepID=A0A843VDW8_COLES|nr:hypothetical protein [Colocasia esculenta]